MLVRLLGERLLPKTGGIVLRLTQREFAFIFLRGWPEEDSMDTTTLLIIIIVVFILFGGGWYGRGRWY